LNERAKLVIFYIMAKKILIFFFGNQKNVRIFAALFRGKSR